MRSAASRSIGESQTPSLTLRRKAWRSLIVAVFVAAPGAAGVYFRTELIGLYRLREIERRPGVLYSNEVLAWKESPARRKALEWYMRSEEAQTSVLRVLCDHFLSSVPDALADYLDTQNSLRRKDYQARGKVLFSTKSDREFLISVVEIDVIKARERGGLKAYWRSNVYRDGTDGAREYKGARPGQFEMGSGLRLTEWEMQPKYFLELLEICPSRFSVATPSESIEIWIARFDELIQNREELLHRFRLDLSCGDLLPDRGPRPWNAAELPLRPWSDWYVLVARAGAEVREE
jgi:hypothetical protein